MEELQLYDITNIPDRISKERELKRWREIMAQQKYEQDYLDGFLDAEARARESNIDRQTYIEHKRRLAMRWFGYYKKATVASKQPLLEQYNRIASMIERGQRG